MRSQPDIQLNHLGGEVGMSVVQTDGVCAGLLGLELVLIGLRVAVFLFGCVNLFLVNDFLKLLLARILDQSKKRKSESRGNSPSVSRPSLVDHG